MTRREGQGILPSDGMEKNGSGCSFADIWDPFAGGFATILLSCRDTFCGLHEDNSCSSLLSNNSTRRRTSPPKSTSSNVFLDPRHHAIQHKDSMSTATPREIDPEKLFGMHSSNFEALDSLALQDDGSCNSSISSKGLGSQTNRGTRMRDELQVPPSEINTFT